jgi:hypothetical protein
MQTFLPYPDFWQSVRALDNARLGKQRVEAMQILTAIETQGAWKHHPAVLMWRKYTTALKVYHNACLREWERRGFVNNMRYFQTPDNIAFPRWLGYEPLHQSHRAMLMYKQKMGDVRGTDYIAMFSGITQYRSEYFWPSRVVEARLIACFDDPWWQVHRVYDGVRPVHSVQKDRYGVSVSGIIRKPTHKLIVDSVI